MLRMLLKVMDMNSSWIMAMMMFMMRIIIMKMMRWISMHFHMGGIFICRSGFICLYFRSEAVMISNIVNDPVNTFVICISISSFYCWMAVTFLLPELWAMVIFNFITKVIWLRMMMMMMVFLKNDIALYIYISKRTFPWWYLI